MLEGVSGRSFEDGQDAEPGVRRGVATSALDTANADRLWELSLELAAA